MTNLLIHACTVASLASAALAGRTPRAVGAQSDSFSCARAFGTTSVPRTR